MNKDQLIEIINKFNDLNVVVIGDIMLDRYLWGTVSRISPEAPVPVVNVDNTEYRVGGAGNVASNLASLECKSTILSITGSDHNATILQNKLEDQNVNVLLHKDQSRCTTIKSRIVAQKQQLVRMDKENTKPFSEVKTDNLLSQLTQSKDHIDAIILSDYNKGLLTKFFIKNVLRKFSSMPIIIDPKVRNYNRYKGASIIKPNYQEFCEANNKDDIAFDKFDYYAEKVLDKYAFQGLIVTLGAGGVYFYKNGKSQIIPTEAHEVYDVSGAGDTFTAAFTASYVISRELSVSAQIGNLASAVAVEKVGTATVKKDELLKKVS